MFEAIDVSTSLPMLLNGIMVAAIAGLWFLWWKNAKRQCQVESMLADSARQLQEASHHLKQAMAHINNTSKKKAAPRQGIAHNPHEERTAAPVPGDARIAHMLRMQREGTPTKDIANKLNLPLSQVRLALKLHTANIH